MWVNEDVYIYLVVIKQKQNGVNWDFWKLLYLYNTRISYSVWVIAGHPAVWFNTE